jgi:hypothetical protein
MVKFNKTETVFNALKNKKPEFPQVFLLRNLYRR